MSSSTSASYVVRPTGRPLTGVVDIPGDKSVSHRALLFSALAEGSVTISGLSDGDDNLRTARALQDLGVAIERQGDVVKIRGVGLRGLRASPRPLDMGNSGTGMRLLLGILAGQPFTSVLIGDESLSSRPMGRVTEPLRAMGADVTGVPGLKPGSVCPPLTVTGGHLKGLTYMLPMASAQVKSALLLAGLYAAGPTELREPGPSRDHTELLLAALGAPIDRPAPFTVRLDPRGWDGRLVGRDLRVPGDPSSAAFLVVAGLLTKARMTIRGVCVNPTRTGFLDVLSAMGAAVKIENSRTISGEPVADLVIDGSGPLVAATVDGDRMVRAIDEVPILAIAAAWASGTTRFRNAEELRVKESDRIATTCAMLTALGVTVTEYPDGFDVKGNGANLFAPGAIHAHGDHRIAMAGAVGALVARAPVTIHDVANVGTSFPRFPALLGSLGADLAHVA